MTSPILKIMVSLSLCLAAGPLQALNPICPPGVYIADPEARQMPDGRVYVYGSRDESPNYWCSYSYDVLSSSDLKNWQVDQLVFATRGEGKQADYTTSLLYAPDCIYHRGTYYLYYCLAGGGEDEGVATATSPIGPFVNGRIIKGANGIDPSAFVDDDGKAYLYWGQWSSKAARLTTNLTAIEPDTLKKDVIYRRGSKYIERPDPSHRTDDFWFNEGSSLRKRNGIYYYVFAEGGRHGSGCCACLAYATSTSPFGPFTYRGVIIDSFGSGPNLVNNHGSIAEINGKWYVFYHRPTHATSTMRKTCVEPIRFKPDGSIPEVEMTTQGIDGPLNPLARMDAARACLMSGNVRVVERRMPADATVEYLAAIKDGDTATWRYFDFTGRNAAQFVCKTWGKNLTAKIEIHLDKADGELLGTCDISPAAAGVTFATHTAALKPATGVHALVLVFKAAKADATGPDLLNLEWFEFQAGEGDNNPAKVSGLVK